MLGNEAVLRVFGTSDGVVFNNNKFFESIDNSQTIGPVLHIVFASCGQFSFLCPQRNVIHPGEYRKRHKGENSSAKDRKRIAN